MRFRGDGAATARDAWWLTVFPGAALTMTVLALYLLAERLHMLSAPALARRVAYHSIEVSEHMSLATPRSVPEAEAR